MVMSIEEYNRNKLRKEVIEVFINLRQKYGYEV